MSNGILSCFCICNATYIIIVNNIIRLATNFAFPPKVISENEKKTKNAKIKHNTTP
jgi:hypothetical protein